MKVTKPWGTSTSQLNRQQSHSAIAYQGCIVLGKGFLVDSNDAAAWIEDDPRNAEVLFHYLNGEDLNSRPDRSASRWVIDFDDRTLNQAKSYALPAARVESEVYPERLTNNRKVYRERWWQYAERRPALRQAISGMDEMLVIALVSKTVMPVRVDGGQVFSHALGVFAMESYADQAVLSSSVHQMWAITYGSTLETRVRYTPSDVFETFPRPIPTGRLKEVGNILEKERNEIMLRRDVGLTALYNLANDPGVATDVDVTRLREVHVEIDEALMEAYGWNDIPLDHGFHTYRQMERFTVSPAARVEILDRLLEENHRRAALEAENGGKATSVRELDLDPELAPEGAMF